ncbi:hypothetical protein ElyMa_004126500 [Elysia marginata]|uniref:C-type lectin domain-containing protein n=1 Tax=Elysia marginata TaxID=1093978 RepID=A0AAV4GFV8_9GAST|nr:hypothetical protein ElyMa_004126500 [Elysia marginata]
MVSPGADNPCRHFLPGAEYFKDNCFLPVREKLTICEARRRCEAQGAFVIEPDTEELRGFVKLFADRHFGELGEIGVTPFDVVQDGGGGDDDVWC